MATEPAEKRAVVFVDGQNLFHAAKEAFGYRHPNYDIQKLATAVASTAGWNLSRVQFYTGIPDESDNSAWHHFWQAKLAVMGRQGIRVFSRPLRYRNQTIALPDGSTHTFLVGQEKGVDIRIALDIVQAVQQDECDVAVVFSQDQDLSEVADEVRSIAEQRGRWIKLVSAFPFSPTIRNRRGINKTDWFRIERAIYDGCIDHRDYRTQR